MDRVLVADVDSLPDWREYDLIIAMGGPMGVYEEVEHPWLVGEKRTIREAVAAGVPYFGVCFGAQLLASALGAEVYRAQLQSSVRPGLPHGSGAPRSGVPRLPA